MEPIDLAQVHSRRRSQFGDPAWVEAHERARSHYRHRIGVVGEEVRTLLAEGDSAPAAADGRDRAHRAIALAAAHSGTTERGVLPRIWQDFCRRGLLGGARLIARELVLWAHHDEVQMRDWWHHGGPADGLRRRAPYLGYLWRSGTPGDRDEVEGELCADLERALTCGADDYRTVRILVAELFDDEDLPTSLAQVIALGDLTYPA